MHMIEVAKPERHADAVVAMTPMALRLSTGRPARSKGLRLGVIAIAACAGVMVASAGTARADPVALSLAMRLSPERFPSLTCQQLRTLERKVLRAGGICERAGGGRGVGRAEPVPLLHPDGAGGGPRVGGVRVRCLGEDERLLPRRAKAYLKDLREAARNKSCEPSR